jgi:AcrR family transcriptional regulator
MEATVLTETYRQLVKSGIGGVSLDEVCHSSGVSKTTIDRYWPSRSALLIDAFSRLEGASEFPLRIDVGDTTRHGQQSRVDMMTRDRHLLGLIEQAVGRKAFSFGGLWRKPLGHFVRGATGTTGKPKVRPFLK